MGFLTLFLIALGLAMDAFAVSVSNGICHRNAGGRQALAAGLTFGLFQAGMPLLGYFAGSTISGAMEALDHWIALILLSFIGVNMIKEAVKELRRPEERDCRKETGGLKALLLQGVATSIDAFAVGVGFAFLNTNIFTAVALIGVITFCTSFAGVFVGKKFGSLFKQKAEIFGGCILIFIGVKIFLEHTVF